jgi:hypothetical protein
MRFVNNERTKAYYASDGTEEMGPKVDFLAK